LEDITTAANAETTTSQSETTFEETLNEISDSLSDLASSDDEPEGEDEETDEENTELGNLSDDDEPGMVMGTITSTVQRRLNSFRPKQMTLDELTLPGWWDETNYLSKRDTEYGMAKLKTTTVGKP
jgi:hypothetical protein